MAELDRGAYAPPTSGSLAFDPRDTRRRRPLPITLILSVVILAVLIGALLFLYRAGTRGDGGEPRPVGDPVGAVREPPPAEAQPIDPATGLEVYTDEAAEPGAPVFTPAPEAPIARTAPAPAPAASVVTGTTGAADVAPSTSVTAPRPARPAATVTTTTPAAAPARTTPAQSAPASAPRAVPAPATTTPARTAPPPVAPAPTPAAPLAAPAGTAGAVSVQIGAYGSRAQAQAALARRPGGAGQRVEEVQVGGKTLYRAITTGFRTRAEAQAYCSADCIIR